jgi:uncharacterized protein
LKRDEKKMEITKKFLEIQNPWWSGVSFKFDPVIDEYRKSRYKIDLNEIAGLNLKENSIHISSGARGIGKTTGLKLLIERLIGERAVSPDKVLYYSCHNIDTYEQLSEIIKHHLRHSKPVKGNPAYIILDEVTMVKDWPQGIVNLLKAEVLKHAAIIVSGSFRGKGEIYRSLIKQKNFKVFEIKARSLDFKSFATLANPGLKKKAISNIKNTDLDFYFDAYCLTGGFTSAVKSYFEKNAVAQSVYSNYLYWLIADIAKSGRDMIVMRHILEQVLAQAGGHLGFKTIAKRTAAGTHKTVAEYLDMLERMFAIRIVCQADKDGRPTSRKAKKIYFTDPFLFWLFYGYIHGSLDYWRFSRDRLHDKKIFKYLIETVALSHLGRTEAAGGREVFFWRDSIKGDEIDFCVKIKKRTVPVLIRYGRKAGEKDFELLKKAGFEKGIIITKSESGKSEGFRLVPLNLFLFNYNEELEY